MLEMRITALVIIFYITFEKFDFSPRYRKDIRELFDKLAVSGRSVSDSSLTDSGKSSPEHMNKNKRIGNYYVCFFCARETMYEQQNKFSNHLCGCVEHDIGTF